VVVVSGTVVGILNARQSVRNEIESTVHLAIQLVKSEIAIGPNERRSPQDWLKHLRSLGPTRHLRIDIRSVPQDAGSASNHSDFEMPSVPNVPEWFAWSVTPEPVTFSQIIELAGGEQRELLIEADPADEIGEAWNEALDFFALIGCMATIVFILITITVERAFKPVSGILDGLDRLENGQYRLQLPEFSLPEFNRIARAINQTAKALESAKQENRSLRQHSLEVREQERQYLARELHDEFGQSLSAIKVVAVSLKNQTLDKTSFGAVESIQMTCDHLFSVLGNILRRLHPLVLDELGLKASMEDMLEAWSAQQPSLKLHYEIDAEIDEFPSRLQIHVFRIVQECLTNILKHARATQVSVRVVIDHPRPMDSDADPNLRIEIHDDGDGFDLGAVKTGFGLRGIRERVEALGGKTSIRAEPGQGVKVAVAIPYIRTDGRP
jgi:two-component system, NarL family, sensor histidine kinase UhpB